MKKSWATFLKKDFNLNSVPEVYFWKSEWETFDPHDHNTSVSLYYFAYRFFYMVWFVGAYTETFVCNAHNDNSYYGLYLTNQTFTVQVIYSVLFFLYITWTLWKKRGNAKLQLNNNYLEKSNKLESGSFHNENYQLPIVCKLLWILMNILNVVPYVVTVIYWLFLYGSSNDTKTCEIIVNIFVHGINSPLALLDAFIVSVPIRRTHAIFAAVFALYYTVFSGFYELFNGRYNEANDKEYIYPMLNWKNQPGFAILTCFCSYVGTFIVHFVMAWGVYRFRIYLKSKFSSKLTINNQKVFDN